MPTKICNSKGTLSIFVRDIDKLVKPRYRANTRSSKNAAGRGNRFLNNPPDIALGSRILVSEISYTRKIEITILAFFEIRIGSSWGVVIELDIS